MATFRETNTTYVELWRKRITIGALAASTATDFLPITGLPPSGLITSINAEVETNNQVAPRLRFKFRRINTAQGATEEDSGAIVIQPCGEGEISPMRAEKINGNTQIQEAITSDYVWSGGVADTPMPYETYAGILYVIVENFGAEALTEGYAELYFGPREKGEL